tara:strand:+ start:445 stop:1239 length:795 start_codon:yes stop_codon:yes gene_type:complete
MEKNNLTNLIKKKIKNQNNIPLFFDNLMIESLITQIHNLNDNWKSRFSKLLIYLNNINSKRYDTFANRERGLCSYSGNKRTFDFFSFCLSQGTHSPIKWKELDIFKSSFDMMVYMQIISEIKPEFIIEYGSGSGGSAIWLSDIASLLSLDTKVLSYDIKKPNIEYENVSFEEIDLTKELPNFKNLDGKKMIIEDAHVNVANVLINLDQFMSKGDYLIIEDSDNKVNDIYQFLSKSKNSYMVDNYYVDFFGRNTISSTDSIFVVS